MSEKLICGLTATEIEQLKAEKGALVLVEVTEDKEVYQVIFKEPTFDQLRSMSKIAKSDDIEAVKVAYNNAIVKAHESIEKRDMLKVKAVQALMDRANQTTAEAKNL